jgi:hypothetical protein
MRDYEGLRGDPPLHGGSFISRYGYGGEILNFRRNGNHLYGFVQTRHGTIDIERLGADGHPHVDDVLVVWRARSLSGSVVVGWYKNARVYREQQKGNPKRRVTTKGESWTVPWHIRAPGSSARLLPPRFRTFNWPASTPGFGSTSFVSFLQEDSSKVRAYRQKLLAYIKRVESGQLGPPTKGKRPAPDQERNLKIEAAGRRAAMKYYYDLGFIPRSVEREKCGYDLVADNGNEELNVELKATAVKHPADVCVGLTPNEFKASRALRTSYRICIVFDALGRPQIREYQWASKGKCWLDLNSSTRLGIQILRAANLTILEPGS